MSGATRAPLRRRLCSASVLALAGCATSPPTRWYTLPLDPPEALPVAAEADDITVWELSSRIGLPGMLDRDTLHVAQGAAGLQPLAGHRWAEPLRDAVPRLLLHDLRLLRGPGRVWVAPAPQGVVAHRRLRVELLLLQADAAQRTLRLAARWWLLDPAAGLVMGPAVTPQPGCADFEVRVGGPGIDALAAAHRLALWRLARRIAGC